MKKTPKQYSAKHSLIPHTPRGRRIFGSGVAACCGFCGGGPPSIPYAKGHWRRPVLRMCDAAVSSCRQRRGTLGRNFRDQLSPAQPVWNHQRDSTERFFHGVVPRAVPQTAMRRRHVQRRRLRRVPCSDFCQRIPGGGARHSPGYARTSGRQWLRASSGSVDVLAPLYTRPEVPVHGGPAYRVS